MTCLGVRLTFDLPGVDLTLDPVDVDLNLTLLTVIDLTWPNKHWYELDLLTFWVLNSGVLRAVRQSGLSSSIIEELLGISKHCNKSLTADSLQIISERCGMNGIRLAWFNGGVARGGGRPLGNPTTIKDEDLLAREHYIVPYFKETGMNQFKWIDQFLVPSLKNKTEIRNQSQFISLASGQMTLNNGFWSKIFSELLLKVWRL